MLPLRFTLIKKLKLSRSVICNDKDPLWLTTDRTKTLIKENNALCKILPRIVNV